MTKLAAFGSVLNMGLRQVETATVVGAITGAGNATFTTTCAGMTGSPIVTAVAVLLSDTPDTVATKATAALLAIANVTALLDISCSGANITLTKKLAAANDATCNLAFTNGTCTGLTPNLTSANTTAGVAFASVAHITNIGGPGLAADTEDVTTHDSAGAFEENVVTVLRTGELSLDLEYDPNAVTHAATSGLLARLANKTPAQFQVVFPGPYTWTFDGRSTGFEPSAPVGGALTATTAIKITGQPSLV